MTAILFNAHSGWRYIVILVAVLAFGKLLVGLLAGSRWNRLDQGLGAALPIVLDIQLLLGLVLWVVQQRWNIPDPTRTWEHPVTMILVIAAAHITWARVKKSNASVAQFQYSTNVAGYAVAIRDREHLVTMILTIVEIAWSRVNKSDASATKYRTGVVGYAVAGILLAVGIMRVTGWM